MEPHDFSVELAAFENKKPKLLNLCEGKFGVFKADRFLGAFDSYLAAYQAGSKEWVNVSFLIKQIVKEERSETMPPFALVLALRDFRTVPSLPGMRSSPARRPDDSWVTSR